MKQLLFAGSTILVLVFFIGFTGEGEMPGPDSAELWDYITKVSSYKDWDFWPGHEGMQPGNAPHGPFHRVFINEILFQAKQTPVPYGSIQVKESYDENKKLAALTAMYKIKDYNPKAGDWYWVKYSTSGKGGPSGKVQGCIGCHAVKASNDYILVHEFK